MEFLHPAMWHDHDIDFVRWPPCNVASGSGIVTVNSPSGSTVAPCNVIHGSGMTCHWMRANVRHTGILHLFPFPHITAVDMSFCTSLYVRNFIQIGPPSAEKMTSCRFLRWRISACQPSWIVGIQKLVPYGHWRSTSNVAPSYRQSTRLWHLP